MPEAEHASSSSSCSKQQHPDESQEHVPEPESPKLKRVHTRASGSGKEKHDEPKPEPPEADEFGLPSVAEGKDEVHAHINGTEDASKSTLTKDEDSPTIKEEREDHLPPLEKTRTISSTNAPESPTFSRHVKNASVTTVGEFSHQQMVPRASLEEQKPAEEDEWQEMPALATHRIYDDWGKVLAREYDEVEDEHVAYATLGGAAKGYTRVQVDEDAQSATSMDDNTAYLFKDAYTRNNTLDEDDEEGRDMLSQMQATKDLLDDGQKIAYVGLVRLSIAAMQQQFDQLERTKNAKKAIDYAAEALKMWSQKTMIRLYTHMDIDAREQIMVEQLAEHGVLPADLTPRLMANARVKNPKAETEQESEPSSSRPSMASQRPSSTLEKRVASAANSSNPGTPAPRDTETPPPFYEEHTAGELTIENPDDYKHAKNLDIDIRWTVLCDLFLLLVADSNYDARSRTLLEKVGASLSVEWQEVCRFEKRVTDALEMQEQAEKENWNEDEHLEARKKAAKRKRLMVMGLCTVGGGLVIGLSSGLLAPVIGAGLAAGFTAVGVTGTGTFLGGAGAAALIGTGGTLIGGRIGQTTSSRRTAAVSTFEYKPLFNNKRVNLIVTVAGWMTGAVDDVRLPFSTVDPIMGDIYSVNWEPEMLQSTGQTIQILGTEALTQTIQQILGATVLATLMAGLQAPIILAKISYLIDNPWTTACARGDAAGLILADSIIDRNLGMRPITLVGFSLGSRVIFACLRELARRGATGLVQNVYMFGSPVVVKKDDWIKARSVVPGRFVNGYATNDWILGYLFRATQGGILRVSGLASVDIKGIENVNVTGEVPGHMAYRGMMPTLLDKVGWQMESLEYSEIEDPDPENHEKRQRELIDEIEEARRQLEEEPQKKGFKSWFTKKKQPQKKSWETYDERSQKVLEGDDKESEQHAAETANVMFNVEAIRAEALKLALQQPGDIEEIKKHLSVKEIQSTLPVLKVQLPKPATADDSMTNTASRPDFKQTQSHNGIMRRHGEPTANSALSRSHDDASRVEMSFESDRHERPNVLTEEMRGSDHASAPQSRYGPPEPARTRFGTPEPQKPEHSWDQRRGVSERPALQSITTTPAPTNVKIASPPVLSPDHNPWSADADDPDFGKEQEVKMTF
ncbi:hypothetical protein AC579_2398 [Pseudocercospora musae]|uniref:DUF726 domain protein n=1 Tax=Pseudocercospora musae TaxID=113226 RepID=A0A139IGF6_9PEZI|nr:hypothetical protein AC579_2398 [Pseudocercospora musae]